MKRIILDATIASLRPAAPGFVAAGPAPSDRAGVARRMSIENRFVSTFCPVDEIIVGQ